jgi:hypothetical protein
MENCDEEEKQNDVVCHVGDVKCAWMCNFNYGILYFHNGVLGSEKKV